MNKILYVGVLVLSCFVAYLLGENAGLVSSSKDNSCRLANLERDLNQTWALLGIKQIVESKNLYMSKKTADEVITERKSERDTFSYPGHYEWKTPNEQKFTWKERPNVSVRDDFELIYGAMPNSAVKHKTIFSAMLSGDIGEAYRIYRLNKPVSEK